MTRTIDPASVLDRLKHVRRTTSPNIPPNTRLLLYAQQGLLGRLDASPSAEQLVLKGALSLFARYGNTARPTQDIDLAARGLAGMPEQVKEVIQDLCTIPFGDGLSFSPESVRVQPINEAFDSPGVSVRVRAMLGPSQVDLQVDGSLEEVGETAQ